MEFTEYIVILISILGLLVSVIAAWFNKDKSKDKSEEQGGKNPVFTVVLAVIFILGIVLGVALTAIYFGGPGGTPETTPPETAAILAVWDTVYFGTYEQDNVSSTRQEAIAWMVLDVQDDRALLLSVDAIDCRPYNDQDDGCTWATCSLRQWLNGDFYNSAFSGEERSRIVKTTVAAQKNPDFPTDPGKNTEDCIFLLSAEEAARYLLSDTDRMCGPTEYATARGAFQDQTRGTCWWWLRTPGETNADACSVNSDGSLDTNDGAVNSNKGCVRPAMWVTLESSKP